MQSSRHQVAVAIQRDRNVGVAHEQRDVSRMDKRSRAREANLEDSVTGVANRLTQYRRRDRWACPSLGDPVDELDDGVDGATDERKGKRFPGGSPDALDATRPQWPTSARHDRVVPVTSVVDHGRSLPVRIASASRQTRGPAW